ncbi:MAG: glycosyltransferase family 39 protein [Candidatus Kaiserbacteria bacterium]|nr:glycosyltransferase family 39 protein [Candidatus Kaiserbacteria bacterium]
MSTKLHTIFLVLLFCAAGFFATYHLTESPPVWYDEGFYTQSAANLAMYGQIGLRIAPDVIEPPSKLITVGYPLIYPLALAFKIFGISILVARSVMVFYIMAFIAACYFLTLRLFGRNLALGTLALLVTLPTLYGNGKSVLGEVPGLMYLTLFLICFVHARSSSAQKYFWLATAGLFAGLCVATKPTFLLLLPAVAIGACVEWRRGTFNIKELLAASLTGLIPVLYWVVTQFRTEDSFSTILIEYSNPYQIKDMLHVILINISHLFTDIGPLYLTIMLCIWAGALLIRYRKREKIPTEEIMVLIFSILSILSYVRTAGWYRYLFEAQALSLIFFPSALFVATTFASEKICILMQRIVLHIPDAKKITIAVIIILTALGAYQILFNSFTAESYDSHKTAFLEMYFGNLSPSTTFFFYNVPETAFFMRGVNYYQFIDSGAGWPIGKEELTAIPEGKADEIILGTDAYAKIDADSFASYKVATKRHDYTILRKVNR